MALHFSAAELAERRDRVCRAMTGRDLDGLLLFRQESLYYLTGYDTFGYVFFQGLYLGGDGRMTLATRAPDLRQARRTSVIDDIRIWVDGPDMDPTRVMADVVEEHRGRRIGVEWDAYGLTAQLGFQLAAALDGVCQTHDASALVSELRAVKSATEVEYIRRAAELTDAAWDAAVDAIHAGADEAAILAAMQGTVISGGGDYPANPFVIGSGPDALLCRYFSGRRRLASSDQLTLEWAGVQRHYHVCSMRTVCVGPPPPRQRELFDRAAEALAATIDALRPGRPIGEAFDAHAAILDAAGLAEHRLNACGYSLGATFAPNWMDRPMLYHANPVMVEAGMVLFCHIIIFDSTAGLAMTLGQTVLTEAGGASPLTRAPLDLLVR